MPKPSNTIEQPSASETAQGRSGVALGAGQVGGQLARVEVAEVLRGFQGLAVEGQVLVLLSQERLDLADDFVNLCPFHDDNRSFRFRCTYPRAKGQTAPFRVKGMALRGMPQGDTPRQARACPGGWL